MVKPWASNVSSTHYSFVDLVEIGTLGTLCQTRHHPEHRITAQRCQEGPLGGSTQPEGSHWGFISSTLLLVLLFVCLFCFKFNWVNSTKPDPGSKPRIPVTCFSKADFQNAWNFFFPREGHLPKILARPLDPNNPTIPLPMSLPLTSAPFRLCTVWLLLALQVDRAHLLVLKQQIYTCLSYQDRCVSQSATNYYYYYYLTKYS